MAVKMTFSLDEATAERLNRASDVLRKPKSEIVREAILDYSERLGRLSEVERRRLLAAFDELVVKIPERAVEEVEAELDALKTARRTGGRRGGLRP